MDLNHICFLAFSFLVLLDPFGNLPVFISIIGNRKPDEYRHIVIRESVFALAGMLAVFFLGGIVMQMLHITSSQLGLAGGLILLLMGIRMVFYTFKQENVSATEKEPYIVPLAVPLICGPGLTAMLITVQQNKLETLLALFPAWFCQMLILLCGKKIAAVLGEKPLNALEALMGLLLAGISVGMIIDNLKIEFAL